MIKSSDILNMINDKSSDLSKEELEEIIETEIQKPEEEMDTDLIEYCLDALTDLEKGGKEGDTNGHEKPNLKKLIAGMVAAIILIVSTFCVVMVLNSGQFDIIKNHQIYGTNLGDELLALGIDDIALPKTLLSSDCEIKDITYDQNGKVKINFNLYEQNISLTISDDIKEETDNIKNPTASLVGNMIIVGNYKVHIVEQNNNCVISYHNEYHSFTIVVPFEYEQAIEFAETIV